MIHREAWHIEADRRRFEELLRLVRDNKLGRDSEEIYSELARYIHRYALKEIPDMPEGHKRNVFLYLYPDFMDYLGRVVRTVIQGTVRQMVPYYQVNDMLHKDALQILIWVEDVAYAFSQSEAPSLATMRKIEEAVGEWEEMLQQEVEPRKGDAPYLERPWLSLETVRDEYIELPAYLERLWPNYYDVT